MFDPTKCHILTFKTVVGMDNAASFTSSRMKDLCQKMEGKINFFDAPILYTGFREPGLLSVWKSLIES